MKRPDPFDAPSEGHEDKLAFEVAMAPNSLESRILHLLAGTPKRFRDFKPLVKGSDTPVTRALKNLSTKGLLVKGMTNDPKDAESWYNLTGLGVHVLFRSHEFRPVSIIVSELRHSHVFPA